MSCQAVVTFEGVNYPPPQNYCMNNHECNDVTCEHLQKLAGRQPRSQGHFPICHWDGEKGRGVGWNFLNSYWSMPFTQLVLIIIILYEIGMQRNMDKNPTVNTPTKFT